MRKLLAEFLREDDSDAFVMDLCFSGTTVCLQSRPNLPLTDLPPFLCRPQFLLPPLLRCPLVRRGDER